VTEEVKMWRSLECGMYMNQIKLGTTWKYQRKLAFILMSLKNWDKKYPPKESQLLALAGVKLAR
jgi:hypothetical protein